MKGPDYASASSSLRRMARRAAGTQPPRRSVLLVVDRAGWILDEVAEHIASNVPDGLPCLVVGDEWTTATDCAIHFISRQWAWNDNALDTVHQSNRLVGVWWHGRLDSPDPAMRAALDRLQRLHHRFDRLQAPCSIARDTLAAIGVPPKKIVLLPEGVDLRLFKPSASETERLTVRRHLGIEPGARVVGCFQKDGDGWGAGETAKFVKGPDVLADALARLHARLPIVALLPGPARGYLTQRLAAASVPFCAPGFVPRVEVPRMYHALDAYVSPSRDEGGPAGVLEAMASGVPVVSTRAGMPVDLIASGANGVLVDVDDAGGLAGALFDLLTAPPERRQSIAREAGATIAAYDWPIVARRYARELYEPLIRQLA